MEYMVDVSKVTFIELKDGKGVIHFDIYDSLSLDKESTVNFMHTLAKGVGLMNEQYNNTKNKFFIITSVDCNKEGDE